MKIKLFQSTLPVWGATRLSLELGRVHFISIHAPRVGSDCTASRRPLHPGYFNPRSPCGERPSIAKLWSSVTYFNPRSPCGERPPPKERRNVPQHFNPRSPCGERLSGHQEALSLGVFQSTLPVWGATALYCTRDGGTMISIHAPRVGSDPVRPWTHGQSVPRFQSTLPVWGATNRNIYSPSFTIFQSTLPVWGATCAGRSPGISERFQSTLPVWGATPCWSMLYFSSRISIHAPRVGSDCRSRRRSWRAADFNPRSPCGERPAPKRSSDFTWKISIHAPRVGSDFIGVNGTA